VGSIAPGRGRKTGVPAEVVDAIVHDTLHAVPDDDSTCWSTRTLGERHGVGKTVARIWRARKIRPWLVETFKLSRDPRFEAKLVDVVGVYLDPPERAVVFSFDEKTQCQALDRTQPSLSPRSPTPSIPGYLTLEPRPEALRVDRHRQQHPQQGPARASRHEPPHQIRDGPLATQILATTATYSSPWRPRRLHAELQAGCLASW
jgi:hypothetical protein